MKSTLALASLALALSVSSAAAAPDLQELITGGAFDLPWTNGLYISAVATPATLGSGHPAYANPSGDHTVMVLATSTNDSGNVILAATDPHGTADYVWEADVFTGDGTSSRGIVVRADPTDGFENNYNFIIRPGLFELRFRKMVNTMPTTLQSFFASSLPAGSIPANTWHRMAIVAVGSKFRCFFDNVELTTTPIEDTQFPTGWVGAYHFKFGATGFEAQFDDLALFSGDATPVANTTWSELKRRYAPAPAPSAAR